MHPRNNAQSGQHKDGLMIYESLFPKSAFLLLLTSRDWPSK